MGRGVTNLDLVDLWPKPDSSFVLTADSFICSQHRDRKMVVNVAIMWYNNIDFLCVLVRFLSAPIKIRLRYGV